MSSSPLATPASAWDCDLRAALQPGPGSLLLGYEFRNRSAHPAYLFNALQRTAPGGGLETTPDIIYSAASGEIVLLSKRIIPVPDDIDVERPEIPWCTRVEPGATFVERVAIPQPLVLHSPYNTPRHPHGDSAAAWFELGFFLATAPLDARPHGNHYVLYPFPPTRQQVLRTGPLGRITLAP